MRTKEGKILYPKHLIFLFLLFFLPQILDCSPTEEFNFITIRRYNLLIKVPRSWRRKLMKANREGLVTVISSPDEKMKFSVWVKESKSETPEQSIQRYIRKTKMKLITEVEKVGIEHINLNEYGGFFTRYSAYESSRLSRGFLFSGSDGIHTFLGRLESNTEIFDSYSSQFNEK